MYSGRDRSHEDSTPYFSTGVKCRYQEGGGWGVMKSFTPHIRQTTMEKEESGGGDAGQQPASQPGRNTAATLTRSPEGRARAGDTPGKTWYPARGEALWGPEHACPTAEGDTSKNSSRLRDVPLRLYPHSHLRGQPAPAPPPSSWALGTQRPRMQGALK